MKGIKFLSGLFCATLLVFILNVPSYAGEEEKFTVNGYISTQVGLFQPLLSSVDTGLYVGRDGFGTVDPDFSFEDHHNEAYRGVNRGGRTVMDTTRPCDPRNAKPGTKCYNVDHGDKGGTLSMFRNVLQLEADWRPIEGVTVHAVFRGARSSSVPADTWIEPPRLSARSDPAGWVRDTYYTEHDLREFYVDVESLDWLSFRLGKQQVTWGETGQYRLLDAINPEDTTWHFGPTESFRDTRTPIWMAKTMLEIPQIEHNVELVWVPMLDGEDSVTVPLTFVGAWGLPFTNTPSPKYWENKYMETDWGVEDSRLGIRWKGTFPGGKSTYSLVYYYTHQLSPPIPHYYIEKTEDNPVLGEVLSGRGDIYLHFPRTNIFGLTWDYAFDSPFGAVLKFEGAYQPDRSYPRQAGSAYGDYDQNYGNGAQRYVFREAKKHTVSAAVALMRPTMIRWLNPTSNILILVQFMGTYVHGITEEEEEDLVAIPGYSEYKQPIFSYTMVGVLATSYLHGAIKPRLVLAYINPDSGFVSFQTEFQLGTHWRLTAQINDFYGNDPYKGVGLFRDRDEVNLKIAYQF